MKLQLRFKNGQLLASLAVVLVMSLGFTLAFATSPAQIPNALLFPYPGAGK